MTNKDTKRKPGRRHHLVVMPYRLLAVMLYGRFDWINRDQLGILRIPVARLCGAISGFRTDRVKHCLQTLEKWGLIRSYCWHGNWFDVELEVPMGMAIHVTAPSILTPQENEPHVMTLERIHGEDNQA